jgi:hypothetical protein
VSDETESTFQQDPGYPDLDQLQQRELRTPSIPVHIPEPVTVHELPSRSGPVVADYLVGGGGWVRILQKDLKRKRVTILFTGDAAGAYLSKAGSGNTGAPWPINVPLVLEHADELYAMAVSTDTADTVIVTNLPEIWAD